MKKITNNHVLIEGYLHQYLSKPWCDNPLEKCINLMESLTLAERNDILNNKTIKALLGRVNNEENY